MSCVCLLQVIGGRFDLVIDTLAQFVDFVNVNIPCSTLAPMLPSFTELTDKYGLSPQLAFAIARPVLRQTIVIAAASAPAGGSKAAAGGAAPAVELDASLAPWNFRGVCVSAANADCLLRCLS